MRKGFASFNNEIQILWESEFIYKENKKTTKSSAI